jgi:hypothetical protein
MFAPYIISKIHTEPRKAELEERERIQWQVKNGKRRESQGTAVSSSLSEQSNNAPIFTPLIVSKNHTEPRKEERKRIQKQKRIKNNKKIYVKQGTDLSALTVESTASSVTATSFTPYLQSKGHVAASIAERED